MSSNEVFVDQDGKKVDSVIHEPVLQDKRADKWASLVAIRRAKERGMSDALAKKLYGLPE